MKTSHSIIPEFTQPGHSALQEHISYYYFSHSQEENYFNEFYFYPHYKSTISIYKGAEAHWTNSSSCTTPIAEKGQVNCYYSSILKNRFRVTTQGCFSKIGIVFNPLGINQFIGHHLIDIAPTQIVELKYFRDDFHQVCSAVFATKDLATKTALLDSFFLSKLQAQKHERIREAVKEVFSLQKNHSVEDIAKQLQIDRKTLYKLFKKHLCCSPSTFRRVVMFREAIEQYMNKQEHIKLCELAYDNYFYDQSHFIRTTEELTEENPRQFFKGITKVGPVDTYWNFPSANLKRN